MANDLTTRERYVVDMLLLRDEVSITELYATIRARAPLTNNRHMQQRLGVKLNRINRKLAAENKRIVPGEARRTYRLVDLPEPSYV